MNFGKFITTQIPLLVLCVSLFASCAEQDDNTINGGETVNASFTVVTRSSGARAVSDEVPENELIKSWWIAFVDKNDGGIVRDIAQSDAALDPTEMDFVDILLPAGNYYAYAFANITPGLLAEKTGITFTKGAKAPSHADIIGCEWSNMENGLGPDTDIPMSGWLEINVKGNVNEPYAIEVIRMLAKIEFEFTNATGSDVTVTGITFGSLNTGKIPLMPGYAALDAGTAPTLISDAAATETIDVPLSRALNLTDAVTASDHFYVRESLAGSHPTGHFHFAVKMKRGTAEQEVRYALTDELTYINRNDYILIPVKLTKWYMRVETLFYPPIGGYPPIVEEVNDNEYYIKFGTQGEFAITPVLIDAATGEKAGFTATVTSVTGVNIFSREPSADALTGEITGELSTATGTAVVEVTITVRPNAGLSETFTRKIYIVRTDNQ